MNKPSHPFGQFEGRLEGRIESLDFEVAVIGAGPAGIAAACAAAEAGKRTALFDNSPWIGGQIWRGEAAKSKQPLAKVWLDRLKRSGAQAFTQAAVIAAPDSKQLQIESNSGAYTVSWRKLILATGARELFIPFPGWTLPGVIGPGGMQAMVKNGWPVHGQRVVVAGSGPLLLAVADGLKQHGAEIRIIAEQAPFSRVLRFAGALLKYPGKLVQGMGVKARLLGVPYRLGCWPVKAEGNGRVQFVTLTNGRKTWTVDCDFLACGFNLAPNAELPVLMGCAIKDGFVQVDTLQKTTVDDVYCAGEPTGIGGVDCALVEGQIAGLAASGLDDRARSLFAGRKRWHCFRDSLAMAFAPRAELRHIATDETIVCRCEDTRRRELELRSGWQDAKLHTRCGMGPCQGRVCGGAVRFLFGWDPVSTRAPIFPARMSSLVSGGISPKVATTHSTKKEHT